MDSLPNKTLAEANEWAQRGVDHLAEGDLHAAAAAFKDAIALDPTHIEAHHGLIRALGDAGDLQDAISAALALISLTPDDPLAHTALSIALQRNGQIPEAESAAGRARILEWKQQLASPSDHPS